MQAADEGYVLPAAYADGEHREKCSDSYTTLTTQLKRHGFELEQQRKSAQRQEEELERTIAVDRKRFPKQLHAEAKTRSLMFKESLRISQCDPADMAAKMRAFDEQVQMTGDKDCRTIASP